MATLQDRNNALAQARGRNQVAWPYIVLLIATGIYLSIELPFGALLIDVVGSDASENEISRLETVGRLIAAAALALAILGRRFVAGVKDPNGRARTALYASIALWAAIIVPSAYFAQKILVDMIVVWSSAETRQAAARAVLLRREIFSGAPKIEGIDINPEDLHKPEWKAFSALVPLLGLYYPDVIEKTGSGINKLLKSELDGKFGDLPTFRTSVFEPAMEPVQQAYRDYVEGEKRYQDASSNLSERADQMWASYQAGLADKRINTRPLMIRYKLEIRKSVRDGGIPVPGNWEPWDEAGFKQAAIEKVSNSLDGSANDKVEQALGQGAKIARGLDEEGFYKQSAVQKKIRAELGLPNSGPIITPTMSDDAMKAAVYDPLLEKEQGKLSQAYLEDTGSFGKDGANEKIGRNAMRAVVVPPLALFFSLLGMTVHIFKFVNFALLAIAAAAPARIPGSARFGNRAVRLAALGGLAILLGLWLHPWQKGLTASPFFQFAESSLSNALPLFPTAVLTTVIESERNAYPVKHAIGMTGVFPLLALYVYDGKVEEQGQE